MTHRDVCVSGIDTLRVMRAYLPPRAAPHRVDADLDLGRQGVVLRKHRGAERCLQRVHIVRLQRIGRAWVEVRLLFNRVKVEKRKRMVDYVIRTMYTYQMNLPHSCRGYPFELAHDA